MVYMHAVVAVFPIYAQHCEDAARGEVEGHALNKSWKLHCCSLKIIEKSWKYVFEILWEPCYTCNCFLDYSYYSQ